MAFGTMCVLQRYLDPQGYRVLQQRHRGYRRGVDGADAGRRPDIPEMKQNPKGPKHQKMWDM